MQIILFHPRRNRQVRLSLCLTEMGYTIQSLRNHQSRPQLSVQLRLFERFDACLLRLTIETPSTGEPTMLGFARGRSEACRRMPKSTRRSRPVGRRMRGSNSKDGSGPSSFPSPISNANFRRLRRCTLPASPLLHRVAISRNQILETKYKAMPARTTMA